MKSVAVVICNYNKRDFVLACIDSVFASDFNGYDVIVVDNASSDGSAEAIRERFGEGVTLIVNSENTGGSGGFNRGMTYAIERGYKYIHLLDNDVLLDTEAIGALYDFMESHPDTGACGSLILKANEPDVIQEYGANIDGLDARLLFREQQDIMNLPEFLKCDYIAACSAMYRVSVLTKTGAIDESFFIYWDDLALSWEIRLAGYDVCAFKKSRVWHHGSFANRSSFNRYYSLRNKIYCFVKYLIDEEFKRFPGVLTARLFRMLAVNRNNPEYCAAYLHALTDALNNVRGKADEYKLTSQSVKRELPGNAVTVQVPHVLDVEHYDRSKVYIDSFQNVLFGKEDFDFVENLVIHFEFFKNAFSGFIESKLHELRKLLRNS